MTATLILRIYIASAQATGAKADGENTVTYLDHHSLACLPKELHGICSVEQGWRLANVKDRHGRSRLSLFRDIGLISETISIRADGAEWCVSDAEIAFAGRGDLIAMGFKTGNWETFVSEFTMARHETLRAIREAADALGKVPSADTSPSSITTEKHVLNCNHLMADAAESGDEEALRYIWNRVANALGKVPLHRDHVIHGICEALGPDYVGVTSDNGHVVAWGREHRLNGLDFREFTIYDPTYRGLRIEAFGSNTTMVHERKLVAEMRRQLAIDGVLDPVDIFVNDPDRWAAIESRAIARALANWVEITADISIFLPGYEPA